jgi:DnaJ-class molecular chaperone
MTDTTLCILCDGSGQALTSVCPRCDGTGKTLVARSKHVLPSNTRQQTYFRGALVSNRKPLFKGKK